MPRHHSCFLRTQLPVKQGLRLLVANFAHWLSLLRTQLPVKQGLRLRSKYVSIYWARTQNPTSSKTRIKTIAFNRHVNSLTLPQNPTSSKTRIKTPHSRKLWSRLWSLRTQLPVKQGLRLCACDPSVFNKSLRTQLPVKQGLRHFRSIIVPLYISTSSEPNFQ